MKLQEWMDREQLRDGGAAHVLGLERSMIYRLRLGQREPSAKVMAEIAARTGGAVMPNDWFGLSSEAERQRLDYSAETPAGEPVKCEKLSNCCGQ